MLQYEYETNNLTTTIDNVCLNGGTCIGNGFVRDKNVFKAAYKNGLNSLLLNAKCKCPSGFTGKYKFFFLN